ncbi:MAG: hypothetical protein IKL55_04605 [Clostridia bacterium]|nr:hypothetical protein [Clostridia bacterium]
MEENFKNENVEINNHSKEKNTKKKKIMTIITVMVVLFLGVNTFAATQGYNNIFFIIRNLVSPEVVESKDKILLDRDITISYQPIKISNDLNIQINKIIVEDEEATLYLDVTNNSNVKQIANYVVYDITDGKKELIGNQMASKIIEGRYVEKIELVNFLNTTKVLQLEIFDENNNKISSLEINLDKKEINILTVAQEEIEKISEVELKEFLSNCLKMRYYDFHIALTDNPTNYYYNELKIEMALKILGKKEEKQEVVHKVIEEFSGESINETLNLAETIVVKSNENYKLIDDEFDKRFRAFCIDISDINYSDGIYNVTGVYVFPDEDSNTNKTIEQLTRYISTVQIAINDNYEYSKYRIFDIDNIDCSFYEEGIKEDEQESNPSSSNTTDNTIVDNVIDDNSNNSNTNTTVPVKPGNLGNRNEDAISGNPENSASTIDWNDFFSPGLRGKIPTGWNIKEFINGYSGPEDDGKLAKSISGTITGIDNSTNKEVISNIIINFYMPEFIDVLNTETYTRIIASRYNMEASWAGYTSPQGMDWKMVVKENNHRQFYCHLEPLSGNREGIGYVIEVISDNFDNDKLINVLYRMFMDLNGASF